MPQVTETVTVNRDADQLWRDIGHFGAVEDWHPMLASVESDGNAPGDVRRVTTNDGGKQIERLETYDEDQRSYRYAIVETVMPIENYTAEFRLDEAGADASQVIWSANFDVASGGAEDAVAMIRDFLRAGLDNLKETKSHAANASASSA